MAKKKKEPAMMQRQVNPIAVAALVLLGMGLLYALALSGR